MGNVASGAVHVVEGTVHAVTTFVGGVVDGVGDFLKHQEIQRNGGKWLDRVADVTVDANEKMNENEKGQVDGSCKSVQWRSLECWKDEFEPPPPDQPEHSSEVHDHNHSTTRAAIRSKTRRALMDSIDRRLVTRFIRLVLDITSQVLTTAESNLSALSLPSSSVSLVPPTVPLRILNNMNGIVLSYRFQDSVSKKHRHHNQYHHHMNGIQMEYYRRIATDNLTEALWDFLPKEGTTTAILELQQEVQRTILYLQEKLLVRPILEAAIDDMFQHLHEKVDVSLQAVDRKVTSAFKDRLVELDRTAHRMTEKIDQVDVMARTAAVAADDVVARAEIIAEELTRADNSTETKEGMRSPLLPYDEAKQSKTALTVLDGEMTKVYETNTAVINTVENTTVILEQNLTDTREYLQREKDDVWSNLTTLVKSFLLEKFDQLAVHITDFIDHFFLAFYELRLVAKLAATKAQKSDVTLQELQDRMYHRINEEAMMVRKRIEMEVNFAVHTIGSLLVHHHDNDDDDVVDGDHLDST
mmetsp:Transcript_28697/g.69602  ORF Transcript_28697/g.69602 Transcript_28697/m.69602 type:complete len:527 (-) Transcript_28697:497-2077(-)